MEQETKVAVVKGGSAWGAAGFANIGVHTWGDAASLLSALSALLAALYTVLLIGDWAHKKIKARGAKDASK